MTPSYKGSRGRALRGDRIAEVQSQKAKGRVSAGQRKNVDDLAL
jgi:hypothetical protein